MSISDNSSTIAPLSDIDGISLSQSQEERSDVPNEDGIKSGTRKASRRLRKHPESMATAFLEEHHVPHEREGDEVVVSYEKSPYADAEIVLLQVGPDAIPFGVHQTILAKSEVLNSRFDRWRMTKQHVPMPELDEVAAHTLVHYLYTGKYEGLSAPPQKAVIPSYKTGTCVYCAAVRYALPGLAELAKEKITSFGEDLKISDILSIAKDHAFPSLPEDETWYPSYLENAIKAAMSKDPEPFRRPDFITSVEGNSRLLQVVWKTVMSNYAATVAVPKPDNDQDITPANKTTPAESVSNKPELKSSEEAHQVATQGPKASIEPQPTMVSEPTVKLQTESNVKSKPVVKAEKNAEIEPAVTNKQTIQTSKAKKSELAINPNSIVKPDLAAKSTKSDAANKSEVPAKGQASKPEALAKAEVVVKPKATVGAKTNLHNVSSIKSVTTPSAPIDDPYKLPEIEPTVETPRAPEPFTDELGFGKSKTYKLMGNNQSGPESQSAPDKQTERPGHKRNDSVLQVESIETPPPQEKVNGIEKVEDVALLEANGSPEPPLSKKARKKAKKAKSKENKEASPVTTPQAIAQN